MAKSPRTVAGWNAENLLEQLADATEYPAAILALNDLQACLDHIRRGGESAYLASEAVVSALALGMRLAKDDPALTTRVVADISRRGGDAANEENRAMKAQAVAWYAEHAAEYAGRRGGKGAAAEYIAAHIVPVKVSTVRAWLRAHRKPRPPKV